MNTSDVVIESAKEILSAVNTAVQTQQYANLSSQIRETVNEARATIQANPVEMPQQAAQKNTAPPPQARPYAQQAQQARPVYTAPVTAQKNPPFFQRKVSHYAGLGSIITGTVGTLIFGMLALGFGVSLPVLGFGIGRLFAFSVFSVLTATFASLIAGGVKTRGLVDRFYEYGNIAGNSEYITIEKLAQATGRKLSAVLSDIRLFKKRDMLPYAVMDKDETTLMLTDRAYKEYVSLDAQRKAFAAQQKENDDAKKQARSEIDRSDLPEDVKSLLTEGQDYLLRVRNYNDEIPDTEEMSTKLYELENIMKRIFEQVKKEPARARELRKFMTYYLPTTDKLLASYVEVCKQGTEGENIRTTKHEIESAMDVINDAFEHLLDKLFEDTAWDVSSDISVMKSMMAQDGLVRPEMEKVKV